MKTIYWILVVFIAAWLGFMFGFIVTRRSATSLKQELRTQLEREFEKAKNEADRIVKEAKNEADRMVEKAKKETEGFALREKAELFKLYPNLKEYRSERNVINEKYIKSFSVRGDKIRIEMHNATSDDIGPDANIIFLNKQGFVTENYELLWIFSRIKPGETRFDEGYVEFKYGEPVYYSIEFSD